MTLSKLKYYCLSFLVSVISFIANYKFEWSKKIDMEKLMDRAIDFSSISFGFLLAVLALLIQSDSPALKRIIENNKFQELINFNKKAVIASLCLAIIAIIYISLQLYNTKEMLFGNKISLRLLFDSMCLATFIFQLVELFLFLDLFYFIIKQKTN